MSRIKRTASIFSVMLLAFIISAPLSLAATTKTKSSIAEVQKETEDFLRSLNSRSAADRDAALAETKSVLHDLDDSIESLESDIADNWDSMSKAARTEARAGMRALRRQRNEVAEAYGQLKQSSASSWEEVKKGFAEAYRDLHADWEKVEKEFGAGK